MKKKWITIAVLTGLGIAGVVGAGVVSIMNQVAWDVLSYQVQYADDEGVTFRIMLGITNPSMFDLDVWNQRYDVFVAGYKVSQITSTQQYRILRDNTSTVPLDIHIKWTDIEAYLVPIGSQTQVTAISELPVLIRGRLSAKIGILKFARFPIRIPGKLGWYLP